MSKKTGEKLEIIIKDTDHHDEAMIEAVERVLHLLKEGYTSGQAGVATWDYTNTYKEGRKGNTQDALLKAAKAARTWLGESGDEGDLEVWNALDAAIREDEKQ